VTDSIEIASYKLQLGRHKLTQLTGLANLIKKTNGMKEDAVKIKCAGVIERIGGIVIWNHSRILQRYTRMNKSDSVKHVKGVSQSSKCTEHLTV
jgi:hypothetical protein